MKNNAIVDSINAVRMSKEHLCDECSLDGEFYACCL